MSRHLFILIAGTLLNIVIINSEVKSEPTLTTAKFETENGFHSLTLPLQNLHKVSDVWKGSAIGELNGKTLGFNFEIQKNSQEEISKGNAGEYSIRFVFSGSLGENFFIELKNRLAATAPAQKPKSDHVFEANGVIDSSNSPDGLPNEFELINLHDETNYGEWYLKINQSRSFLIISEKNEMYREALILTLSSK